MLGIFHSDTSHPPTFSKGHIVSADCFSTIFSIIRIQSDLLTLELKNNWTVLICDWQSHSELDC